MQFPQISDRIEKKKEKEPQKKRIKTEKGRNVMIVSLRRQLAQAPNPSPIRIPPSPFCMARCFRDPLGSLLTGTTILVPEAPDSVQIGSTWLPSGAKSGLSSPRSAFLCLPLSTKSNQNGHGVRQSRSRSQIQSRASIAVRFPYQLLLLHLFYAGHTRFCTVY
jgi:hypothetical protein